MTLIDGKSTAAQIKAEIAEEVKEMVANGQRAPHLAAILVGHDGGSETYVANKVKACGECGFKSSLIRFEEDVTEDRLLEEIKRLNEDPEVDGFIVQLPLPRHIDEQKLTPALEKQILAATELQEVEDLYLPYKQKRQTKAQQARQHGLTPLANWLLSYPGEELLTEAKKYVNEDVPDAQAALDGAHEILAEAISEMATVRSWLRNYTNQHGQVQTAVKKDGEEKDELGTFQHLHIGHGIVRRRNSTERTVVFISLYH